MMYIVSNVRVELLETNLKKVIAKKLGIKEDKILNYKYYKKALDSRNKEHLFYLCHFLVEVDTSLTKRISKNKDVKEYVPYKFEISKVNSSQEVVVVGMGPAGLFASYVLALGGVKVTLIEKGKPVEERVKDVEKFFNEGTLNVNSNLQYGEGGAGTFSDGKLNTNINDKRIDFIKETFVKFGASEDIRYLSKPHIGSDILRKVVKNFRLELINLGVKVFFETELVDLEIENNSLKSIKLHDLDRDEIFTKDCNDLFLATGHSARNIFHLLDNKGINLERKPFSIGVRIEQLQEKINLVQYGEKYYRGYNLPSADYKFAIHLDNSRSLYTFCMCPGGVVVASSSENGEIVTNGMSNHDRNETNANSALLVNVEDKDLDSDLFAGVEFQKKYEKMAYDIAKNYAAPCQVVGDLLKDKESSKCKSVKPSYPLGVVYTSLRKCLPDFVYDTLKEGIPLINKKIPGFITDDDLLIGVETRTSSPLRIVRDDNYSTSVKGIYPIGEGSGYSSGITTSALDGIRVAINYLERQKRKSN